MFRAGESRHAQQPLLRVPAHPASHQEGHVRAAWWTRYRQTKPFLALHLSGGTTVCSAKKLTLLGGGLDLHAGQLVDRTGGLHMPFQWAVA
ncbi:MAG: hypothetical protein ACLS7Z_11550 [Christensenellales bacterium]